MRFYKIQPKEIPGNAISLFDDGWGLLTAGTPENYNTMTISWGQMGCLWNRPVCTVYVRPCRYTYTFTEACDRFTVSLFEPGEQRSELKMLGTQSGREMDKMHHSGLTPMMLDGLMAYEEAKVVLVLRKLYDQQFDPTRVPAEVANSNYATVADDDLHRQYICLIESVYSRD